MKKYSFYIAVLLIVGSCRNTTTLSPHIRSISVSVIRDISDPHKLVPETNSLLALYKCERNQDAELQLRIRSISDKMLTPLASCHLPSRTESEKNNQDDDPLFRKKCIRGFYSTAKQKIDGFNSYADTTKELENSEVMRTIFSELEYLAGSHYEQKIVTVYSDLFEKSDLYDFYLCGPISPYILEELVSKHNLIPKPLSGITVYFIFLAKDRKEDTNYRQMVTAFKSVIEKSGGIVYIQATNNLLNE